MARLATLVITLNTAATSESDGAVANSAVCIAWRTPIATIPPNAAVDLNEATEAAVTAYAPSLALMAAISAATCSRLYLARTAVTASPTRP